MSLQGSMRLKMSGVRISEQCDVARHTGLEYLGHSVSSCQKKDDDPVYAPKPV